MNISRTATNPAATAAAIARALESRAAKAAAAPTATPERAPVQGASLWDLLTPEEQTFFARQDELGALTYGPRDASRGARPSAATPLGGRIDVRA